MLIVSSYKVTFYSDKFNARKWFERIIRRIIDYEVNPETSD